MEFKGLEKKVGYYWMSWRLVLLVFVLVPFIIGITQIPEDYLLILLIPGGLLVLLVAVFTFVFSFLDKKVYKYYIDEEKIIVSHGVLFRHYIVIPVVQIQDIGTFQGPIQLALKLSNIIITTAGSTERISCVNSHLAKDIVDDMQVKIHNRMNVKAEEINNETL